MLAVWQVQPLCIVLLIGLVIDRVAGRSPASALEELSSVCLGIYRKHEAFVVIHSRSWTKSTCEEWGNAGHDT